MNRSTGLHVLGAALATLFGATSAFAQAAPATTRVIGFDQAIAIALAQNDTLRQARNTAALGELDVAQARRSFLPDLRATGQTSRAFGRADGDSTRSTRLGVSSGITLFDGFANTASLASAKFARRSTNRCRSELRFCGLQRKVASPRCSLLLEHWKIRPTSMRARGLFSRGRAPSKWMPL